LTKREKSEEREKMIFVNPENNKPQILLYLAGYQPYRIHGERNPNFDDRGRQILDLKDEKENAISALYNEIDRMLAHDFAIAVVPSHDPSKTTSGIRTLAIRLATNGRVDATTCLVRHTYIGKLAHGGNRDINVHLDSIIVRDSHLIRNREVLLLDDVSTSGNSLDACAQLLLNAGATVVQKFAITRTVHG
jgi:hypothetical protein